MSHQIRCRTSNESPLGKVVIPSAGSRRRHLVTTAFAAVTTASLLAAPAEAHDGAGHNDHSGHEHQHEHSERRSEQGHEHHAEHHHDHTTHEGHAGHDMSAMSPERPSRATLLGMGALSVVLLGATITIVLAWAGGS